ncbi:PHD finger protein 13-like isoform X1 [Ylistrum balloti]|uniref:PHD finger protein 13-like isoform X1 n=1 Tax=Ylistrum balloti TaxID=509963 RepID=UPI002905B60B|nr:PHD finger protein 13-like isoform X1 [Ylistrum balloti]
MTDDIFKAPRNRRPINRHDFEHSVGVPPSKRKKTKEDFYTFCTMILEYTQYESHRQEELRAQNNISPLDSSGSTAESYSSDTTLSAESPGHLELSHHLDMADSDNSQYMDDEHYGYSDTNFPDGRGMQDDESWELITCFCLKPYAGRPMIECSDCNTWIHLSCAKIRKNNIPDTYICQNCRDSRYTKRKSNRIRTENNKFNV